MFNSNSEPKTFRFSARISFAWSYRMSRDITEAYDAESELLTRRTDRYGFSQNTPLIINAMVLRNQR